VPDFNLRVEYLEEKASGFPREAQADRPDLFVINFVD
jgi:hypothetical protein